MTNGKEKIVDYGISAGELFYALFVSFLLLLYPLTRNYDLQFSLGLVVASLTIWLYDREKRRSFGLKEWKNK